MANLSNNPDVLTHWARHATAARALREVLAFFDAAGIRAIPVKGILTAHLLYDDVAERPIADIDVRIARKDYRRFLRLARARGWRPLVASPHLWEAVLQLDDWTIDVECTLSDPGLCAISIEDLMGRARRSVEPFGFEHLQPEIHDHALLLVLNAFKDGLRPFPWALEDLLRIVVHADFKADALVARARVGRVVTALWLVADWLGRDHGAAGWKDVQARIGRVAPSRRVARSYEAALPRWSSRAGFLLTASASDDPLHASWGFALALAGIVRGRINRLRNG